MVDSQTMDLPLDLAVFEQKAGKAADLLRLMSNPHRLMILCQLGGGELSVGALQDRIGLSQSALSQHLAKLRSEGLVTTRRNSQMIFYSISDPAVGKVIHTLAEIYCPELLT